MEQTKKIPKCLNPSCYSLPAFKTWDDLAHHIVENKKTHPRSSLIFAYHILSEVNDKKEFKAPMPMSDEIKQLAKDTVRELSGETKKGKVKCPSCGNFHYTEIEIEHAEASWAWRGLDGALMINCDGCRSVLGRKKEYVRG